MKKTALVFSVLILTASFAWAEQDSFHKGVFANLGGGGSIDPDQAGNSVGMQLSLGYDFEPHWAVEADYLLLHSQPNTVATNRDRVLASLRWTPVTANVEPFLIAGGGAEFDNVSSSYWNGSEGININNNYTYPDFAIGIGVQTNFKGVFNLFAQASCNFVLTSGSTPTFPLMGGIQLTF